MLQRIKAYVRLNIQVLLLDKLSFAWGIILPAIFLLINKDYVQGVYYLIPYWIYMIMNAYFYGVGLSFVRMRESGYLKLVFSLRKSPIELLSSLILTQYVYLAICLTVFNLFAFILFQFSLLQMLFLSVAYILLLTPVALISMVFMLGNVSIQTISTIFSIALFVLLTLASRLNVLNIINPFIYFSKLLLQPTSRNIIGYALLCTGTFFLTTYILEKMPINSLERR